MLAVPLTLGKKICICVWCFYSNYFLKYSSVLWKGGCQVSSLASTKGTGGWQKDLVTSHCSRDSGEAWGLSSQESISWRRGGLRWLVELRLCSAGHNTLQGYLIKESWCARNPVGTDPDRVPSLCSCHSWSSHTRQADGTWIWNRALC